MGGHGWAEVVVDGCGLGMGTNSKEMFGSNGQWEDSHPIMSKPRFSCSTT